MTSRRVHPSIFMVLILPFGAMSGYLTVSVAYFLTHAGVSVALVASLVALGLLPHTWKFLWAPIADTTLSRKTWYVIAGAVSALGIFAIGALPATSAGLALLSATVLIANVAVTFLGMAVESLMAYGTPEEEKGRAGGWFQAGNLGGGGIGGGAGLWMAQYLHPHWVSGAIVGAACFLCCAALFFVPEPPASLHTGKLTRNLGLVVLDVWGTVRSRLGLIALVLCFLPLGTGAASNLWSAVSGDWHASANAVAFATGVIAGLVMAVGCLAGGWICDRMDRKIAYVGYGVLQAACAVAMAVAPRNQPTYIVFTLAYAFTSGLAYAGFTAFVLEAMGTGAAASKYSLFASLSNMPIWYMTSIEGWAHGRWGSGGMLYVEAAFGIFGLLAFVAVTSSLPRRELVPAFVPE